MFVPGLFWDKMVQSDRKKAEGRRQKVGGKLDRSAVFIDVGNEGQWDRYFEPNESGRILVSAIDADHICNEH